MDRQSFHTSLLGGFRKKDVVAYLAEERQRQRQELEELQEKLAALEHSAADTESQDRAGRQQAEELQAQLEALQEENRQQAEELETLRAAADRSRTVRDMELETLRARIRTLEAGQNTPRELQQSRQALEEQQQRADRLEEEQRQRADRLEEELRQRADRLEEELRQLQNAKVVGADREEQLRVLCRRLERSLELLDRAMDGPHHMVCYPVTEEDKTLLRQSGVILGSVPQETPAQPEEPQPAQPDKKPPEEPGDATVSRLMEKVRGWRK